MDRYRFQAAKGQHVVVAAKARELIPYISDAVPGWFQATLGLTDSQGREVQYADHFLFHPDPVLYYEIPEDGAYTLEIHDSIYRGREDFVYRIDVGELPFVTGIFPLGGRTGTRVAVELKGWNLPAGKFTEETKGKPPASIPSPRATASSSPIVRRSPSTPCPKCLRRNPTIARRTHSASACR